MSNYLVDGADLTSIANAIRTKGGTSAQLAFPQGFVDAVEAIETGIEPSGTKQISITANGTTTEDVANYANAEISVNVQGTGDYVAADWLNASKPTGVLTDTGGGTRPSFSFALYNRTGITGLNFPNATVGNKNGVRDCKNIVTIYAPNMTDLRESAFNQVGVVTAVFPKLKEIGNYGIVSTNMVALDIYGGNASTVGISTYGLVGNTNLKTIVIRATSGVMKLYHATNSLKNTPFASGNAGGTLYVPQALIADYQAATNWSTILGYANNQILPIEGSIYETQYVDGTPIPTT